ncbi:MAG: SHOCT domain-containing protein [Rhizobacter sp.]|nr:SHOCT domain-containing protein [Rhizobacter sp.]
MTARAWRWWCALGLAACFMTTAAAAAESAQRLWQIGEFTAIRLVPREEGAEPTQHPAAVPPEQLRQMLASVRVMLRGKSEALFTADELNELVEPLAQALAAATPADDLLLLSTSRRSEVLLAPKSGLTARLFVQANALNLIVHDARLEFMGAWIGTRIPPKFTYGSRKAASGVQLQSATGASRRADWLALPLAATSAAPAPVAMPAAMPAPAPAPPGTPAAAPAPVRDPAFFQEQEQRLRALKRLLDQGLITEAEYQQKRREIVQSL